MPVEQPQPREYGPGAPVTAPGESADTGSEPDEHSTRTIANDGPDEPEGDVPVEVRVRGLVAGLEGIEQLPLAEHAPRYADVHAQLQGALIEIDGESGG